MNNKNFTAVYCITNKADGRKYIGSTTTGWYRLNKHLNQLENGNHYCEDMQIAFENYGEDVFEIIILENCNPRILRNRERYWIKEYRTTEEKHGYNVDCNDAYELFDDDGRTEAMIYDYNQRIKKAGYRMAVNRKGNNVYINVFERGKNGKHVETFKIL